MDRREFLALTTKLAAAAAVPASLYGCGGGSSSSASAAETNSTVDTKVASINTQQTEIDSTNSDLNSNLSDDLTGSQNNNANNSNLLRNNSDINTSMAQFLSTRNPGTLLGLGNSVYSEGHYLDVTTQLSGTQFWQKALDSHEQAYLDYQQQAEKLKAALRLFDANNINTSTASTSSVRTVSLANTREASSGLSDALTSLIGYFGTNLVNSLMDSGVVDTIVGALVSIKDYLLTTTFSQSVLSEVYTVISQLLDSVQESSLENLSFTDQNSVLLSLSKISVASAAVLANQKINELDTTSEESDFVESQLLNNDVLNKLSLKWLTLAQSILTSTVSKATGAIDGAVADESFAGDPEASNDLFASSAILAMTSLAIKTVSGNFDSQLTDLASGGGASFETSSTTDMYRPVFTSSSNSYDQELQANVPGLGAETTEQYQDQLNIASISNATISSTAPESTSDNADEIYGYAAEIAAVGSIIEAPIDFTELLATYAYNFASDTETHAFEFAMQGMEYGYLFASQGEDVGVMADRILWMAVQIGVMADRIGEMADRIVYTEHLIVYTEMLIVDFGILIYGVIKQISNSMLMGLALVMDREWYGDVAIEQANAEDVVLNTIGSNISIMLENMNTYSLAVLDNQQALRESTQSAIATIDFASTEG